MGLIAFKMLLFFMSGIQFTVGQVTITTTPAVIESEITKSLVVTCRFPPQPSSGYQVFSLAVKKLTANSTLEQLASIHRDTHSTVHIDSYSYGIKAGSGVIDSTLGSFMSLEWLNPNVSESGTYQCKANVFNQADDIFVFTENKTVPFTQSSVGSLTHRLLELESEMNNKLQKQDNDFKNLTAQSTRTENKLQKLERKFQDLESTIFKKSTVFNGRQYYLSLYEPNSAVNAEMACKALGGYLAEVDSKNEFDFLKTLIGMPSAQGISFLLGGTDEGHEGRWINRHSGTPLGYTSWLQGTPDDVLYNGLTENCQTMVYWASVNDFVMNDLHCFNSNLEMLKFYFICEVPI